MEIKIMWLNHYFKKILKIIFNEDGSIFYYDK